jgi:hypothetical protein
MAMRPSMHFKDVPFQLQATDIKKHILNVDSRFREAGGSTADFYFRLLSPVKNVLRIRITSVEMPNNFYMFSILRRNVTLRILSGAGLATTKIITVPEGNYSAFDMVDALNASLVAAGLPWLTMSFSLVTGSFTFTGTQVFAVDTGVDDVIPAVTWPRTCDYGLGYNMGFSRGIFDSGTPDASGNRFVTSDQLSYFAGDAYVFLKINDFECVRQTNVGSDFTALAKIVVREPKNYMTFDDYASQHAKEVVFPTPQDLSRLRVRLLDAYGEPIDMGSTHMSFSIEVLEIMNLSLYNTVRDAFAVGWSV